jgi:hypothetical protein
MWPGSIGVKRLINGLDAIFDEDVRLPMVSATKM